MLRIGGSVERYAVEQVLGEGGMAVVYRVRHVTLGTRHALKVLSVTSRNVRERLIQEGRVQATLQHPNVVAVTDVLDVNGAQGLLMEYVAGPPLDRLLAMARPDLDDALALFRGICAGVAHAHTRGLIHRDLKPANVMLQLTDAGLVPKVTDFGLAKALDGGASNRTRTGATMGTPAYMPPEQIRDASKVDRRADMYALGCILYELVCGRPPYVGDDLMELFAAIGDGDHPPPRELAPDLPDPVVAAIEGLLAVDPADRIPDCSALARVLDGHPVAQTRIAVPVGEALPPAPPLPPSSEPASLSLDSGLGHLARDLARSAFDVEEVPTAPSATGAESGETWSGMTLPAGFTQHTLAVEERAPPTRRPGGARWRAAAMVLGALVLLVGGGLGGGALVAGGAALLVQLGLTGAPDAMEPEREGPAVVAPAPAPEPHAAPEVPEPQQGDDATPEPEELVAPAPEVVVAPAPKPAAPKPAAPKPVAPKPVAPKPVAPKPAAPEAGAPTQGATFAFDEASLVYLEATDGRRYRRGELVPAGTYRILALFPGAAELTGAGRVTLAAGDHVELRCNARALQCR